MTCAFCNDPPCPDCGHCPRAGHAETCPSEAAQGARAWIASLDRPRPARINRERAVGEHATLLDLLLYDEEGRA